jgi:hypothetical protein
MTNAFCASVNFDAFMPRLLAQPRKSEAENSSSKRSSFQVAEHLRKRTLKRSRYSNERISSVLKEQWREWQLSHLPKPPCSPRTNTARAFEPAFTLHLKPLPNKKIASPGRGDFRPEPSEQSLSGRSYLAAEECQCEGGGCSAFLGSML